MDDAEKKAMRAARLKRLESAVTPQGVSNAPIQLVAQQRATKIADWIYWPEERTVEVWQAISLSLEIDPDSLRINEFGHIVDLMTPAVRSEFLRRMGLLTNLTEKRKAKIGYFASLLKSLPMPQEMTAMVCDASGDRPVTSSNQSESHQLQPSTVGDSSGQADTGAPATAGQKNPEKSGVDRNRIIAAFPPPRGVTPERWSSRLGEPSKRMKEARVFSGGRGVSALWNPAKFAMWYADEKHSTIHNLTTIMRREFSDWLPEWEKYTDSFK